MWKLVRRGCEGRECGSVGGMKIRFWGPSFWKLASFWKQEGGWLGVGGPSGSNLEGQPLGRQSNEA